VPTTAGTGAETNAFAVVTDPATRRTFYVGHASSRPAAAILDPDLTAGLPPGATAATGMDALTHALESCMSSRANPWSDGIALQVIRMIAAYLPPATASGAPTAALGHLPRHRAPAAASGAPAAASRAPPAASRARTGCPGHPRGVPGTHWASRTPAAA
jgi:alcohol dehydrogenase class IV